MSDSISDRQKDYEHVVDYQLMKRVPVMIRVDGKGFTKLTQNLERPSYDFLHVMANTMLYCIKEMQGAVFGYAQSDEITFVLKNDQSLESAPWFQNRVQKIASTSAALATKGFERSLQTLDKSLDLVGDAIFDARTFSVPSIGEAANNLIWRQQDCYRNAVSMASQNNLLQKIGDKKALRLLHGKSTQERKKLLLEKCGIDFDDRYQPSFRKGIAAYRIPTLVKDDVSRNKWTLNFDLPFFVEDKDFLYNILLNGHDIFRAPPELLTE